MNEKGGVLMPIGDRIRYYRELAGLTMEELAKKAGVQKSAINKYEKGVVTNIPIKRVVLIADALGVEPVALTDWERPFGAIDPSVPEKKQALIDRVLHMDSAQLDKLARLLDIVEGK